MRRIHFIGPLSGQGQKECGEKAKNRVLLNRLGQFSSLKVVNINTNKWKQRPLVLIKVLLCLFSRDSIVLSTSSYTAYFFLRVAYALGKSDQVTYFVIGGVLHDLVSSGRFNLKVYKRLKHIYVENNDMKDTLHSLGLSNVLYLSNMREVGRFGEIKTMNKTSHAAESQLKLVFVSRVHPEKGIGLLIDAIKELNYMGYTEQLSLSIYGEIPEFYKERFNSLIEGIPNVSYLGYLNLSEKEGYENLASYDLLVFPTWWRGEGMPGIIIDSFIAGVPVMASDWRYNSSLIQEGYNGYLVKAKSLESLKTKIHALLKDNDGILEGLSEGAFDSAQFFDSHSVITEEIVYEL